MGQGPLSDRGHVSRVVVAHQRVEKSGSGEFVSHRAARGLIRRGRPTARRLRPSLQTGEMERAGVPRQQPPRSRGARARHTARHGGCARSNSVLNTGLGKLKAPRPRARARFPNGSRGVRRDCCIIRVSASESPHRTRGSGATQPKTAISPKRMQAKGGETQRPRPRRKNSTTTGRAKSREMASWRRRPAVPRGPGGEGKDRPVQQRRRSLLADGARTVISTSTRHNLAAYEEAGLDEHTPAPAHHGMPVPRGSRRRCCARPQRRGR